MQGLLFKKLTDFCKIFGITKADCNCSDPFIYEALVNFTICHHDNDHHQQTSHVSVVDNPSFRITYAVISCVVAVIGILGNVYLLSRQNKKRRDAATGSYQRIVMYSSLCNVIYGALFLVPAVTNYWSAQWTLGEPLCKVLYSLVPAGSAMSIGFVTIMSFERYSGINNLISSMTNRKIIILSLVNVVIAITSVIPRFLHLELDSETSICEVRYPSYEFAITYNVIYLLLDNIAPLTFTVLFYFRISRILHKAVLQNRFLRESIDKRVFEKKVKQTFRIKRIVKVIIISFSVTVPVYQLCYISILLVGSLDRTVYEIMTLFSLLAYQSHVAFHPVLFSGVYKGWVKALRSLGRRCVKRSKLLTGSYEIQSTSTTETPFIDEAHNQTSEIEL